MRHTPYVTPFTLVRQSRVHFLPLASKHPTGERSVNWLFVYFCVVRSFEKEDFLKKNSCILSYLVLLKSVLFNLLCVFHLYVLVNQGFIG